jgi:uncharacterized membrane protein
MQPNIFFHESFGKFLFIIFDLLCGILIVKINSSQTKREHIWSVIFWFYNPVTIAISSRGNAESLMAFLVLTFVYLFSRRSFILAGVVYAFAIHFKIYPVIYGLALLLSMINVKTVKKLSPFLMLKSIIFNFNVWKFGFAFLFTMIGLSSFFFYK